MYITVKITNAYLRGEWWHFRMNVPPSLQKHYGYTRHTESLKTKDPLEAKQRADIKTAFFKAQHKQLKSSSNGKIENQPSASDPVPLNPIENHMQLVEHVLKLETFALKGYLDRCEKTYESLKVLLLADDGLSVTSLKSFKLNHLLKRGTNLYDLCTQIYVGKDLSNKGVRNATARKTINKLMDYIVQVSDEMASALRIPNKVISAPSVHSPSASQQTVIPSSIQKAKPAPSLSEVLEGCLTEKRRGAITVDALRSSTGLLVEWYGDNPISFYTRERMKSFVDDCLLHLPPNRNKVKKWKKYSLKEMVKKTKPEDLIAPDTMHNILSDLTTVFTYAVDEYDEFVSKHPTLKLSAKLPEKDDDVDRSFSDEELKVILDNLEYDPKWPSRYWVVMLGFFTGARLNELCQLHLNDIKKADDFYYISINIDDADETFKRVKNKPSRRTVPIHPKIIEIGFLNYVKQRAKDAKGENKQLFPELVYKEKSGYGRQVGDWLRRYRKKLKIMNPVNRGFHGFRHTFIMWAQNKAEMSDREILELTGHENKAISKDHRRYAHALTANRLNTQLVKLDYGLAVPANPYMESDSKES